MKKPATPEPVDHPTPQSGGSYMRDDATGELTRIPDPALAAPATDNGEST